MIPYFLHTFSISSIICFLYDTFFPVLFLIFQILIPASLHSFFIHYLPHNLFSSTFIPFFPPSFLTYCLMFYSIHSRIKNSHISFVNKQQNNKNCKPRTTQHKTKYRHISLWVNKKKNWLLSIAKSMSDENPEGFQRHFHILYFYRLIYVLKRLKCRNKDLEIRGTCPGQ